MTKHTLQQSHGPAYTRIYSVGAARGDDAVDVVGLGDAAFVQEALRGTPAFDSLVNDAEAGRPRALAAFRQAGGARLLGI